MDITHYTDGLINTKYVIIVVNVFYLLLGNPQ